jgi:hypothetical protein
MFRGLAVKALHGRVQAGLEAYNRHAAAEVEGLLEVQRTLGQREAELSRMVSQAGTWRAVRWRRLLYFVAWRE